MPMREGTGAVIRVEPSGRTVHLLEGETLLDAAFRDGPGWPTSCYGQLRCGACVVTVLEGAEHLNDPAADERMLRDRLARLRGVDPERLRLACRLRATGDVVVVVEHPRVGV